MRPSAPCPAGRAPSPAATRRARVLTSLLNLPFAHLLGLSLSLERDGGKAPARYPPRPAAVERSVEVVTHPPILLPAGHWTPANACPRRLNPPEPREGKTRCEFERLLASGGSCARPSPGRPRRQCLTPRSPSPRPRQAAVLAADNLLGTAPEMCTSIGGANVAVIVGCESLFAVLARLRASSADARPCSLAAHSARHRRLEQPRRHIAGAQGVSLGRPLACGRLLRP